MSGAGELGDLASRVAVAARVVALVFLIPLTLVRGPQDAATPLLLVIALAAVLSVATLVGGVPQDLLALAEGAGVAAIGVLTQPAGNAVLPYLVVPMLIAAVAARLPGLVRVLVAEALVAAVSWWPVNGRPTLTQTRSLLIWLGVALVVGLLVVLAHRRLAGRSDDGSYHDAIELIQQLDALSGRLRGGLDPVTLAEQIMAEADLHLPVQQAAVFTRTPFGTVAPLRYSTFSAPATFGGLDDFVENCWRSERPLVREHIAGVPVRTGTRTVGVLALDLPQPPDHRNLARLQEALGGTALQLHAALLFDSVRDRATSEERNRLAREVHDGVAQDVASLGYMVDGLSASLGATALSDHQHDQLTALRGEVTRVVAELRASVYDLRNEMRAGQGLGQGVSAFARQIGSRSDLTVHVRLDEGATRLRPHVEAELLRIAQEAMNNARRHSEGHNLWVSCTVRPPYAELEVTDDGVGLQPGRDDSHGLRIMRERAESIGANLEVADRDAGEPGTRLRVRLGRPPGTA